MNIYLEFIASRQEQMNNFMLNTNNEISFILF